MLKEARELQKAMVAIIRSWRPDLLEEFGVGPIVAATVLCAWSHPGRTTPRRRSRCSPASHRSRRTVAKSPPVIGSTVTATARLNHALHTVVASRIQYQPAHPRLRRTAELPKARPTDEIKRCLARYVARDLYRLLENTATAA